MRKLIAGIAFALAAGTAFAGSCPKEMKAIDSALPGAKLDAAQTAEVKRLRAEGETLHKEGKHAESLAALGKAKGMLGIK